MERMRKHTRHEQRLGRPEQPGPRGLRNSVGAFAAEVLEGPCEEIVAVAGSAGEGTTSSNASRCMANFDLHDIRSETNTRTLDVYSPTCEASETFVNLNGLKSSLIGGPFLRTRGPKKGFGGPCAAASDGFGLGDADALPFPGPDGVCDRIVR